MTILILSHIQTNGTKNFITLDDIEAKSIISSPTDVYNDTFEDFIQIHLMVYKKAVSSREFDVVLCITVCGGQWQWTESRYLDNGGPTSALCTQTLTRVQPGVTIYNTANAEWWPSCPV